MEPLVAAGSMIAFAGVILFAYVLFSGDSVTVNNSVAAKP